MDENYELRDREYPLQEDTAREEDEETSFSEMENRNLTDLFWDAPDAPIFDPEEDPKHASQREELEKTKKNSFFREYLKENLGISTSSTAGKYSKELYDNSEIILNKKSGNITGLEYKGKRIIVKKNQFTKDRRLAITINQFNDTLKKAEQEYQNTTSSLIEKETGLISTPIEENVRENVSFELEERIDNLKSEIENTSNQEEFLSPEEIREANSIIRNGALSQNLPTLDKINFMEIEKKHFENKKLNATSESRKSYYEAIEKITQLQIDDFYMEEDKKPESEEALEILREEARNNDLVRLEKFKRWAKENLLGLSAVAITIGGIITTVVMAGRRVIKQGASAFAKFANAVAKVAAKAGPILSSILGLIATALKWGAKGIMFLSNNLWIIAVFLTYAIVENKNGGRLRLKKV